MKKYVAFILLMVCVLGVVGCTNEQEKSMSYHVIHFTIPAGSDEVIFASEQDYFKDGRVTISAEYEVDDDRMLTVWVRDTTLDGDSEQSTDTTAIVAPNSTIEMNLAGETWYEIGVHLTNHSADDIPVTITLHDESWKQ